MSSFSDTTKSTDTNSSLEPTQFDQSMLDPLTMRARRIERVPAIEKIYRGITSSIRLVPDFLIIGTQRGGTTALYHYLKTHPCIRPATILDTHFFDKKYSKGLGWYRGHFPTFLEKSYAQRVLNRAFVTGEASASYLFHPHTPKRVAQVLPHVKLIVLLRNPVDRAYSQYYHAIELGHETLSFEEALDSEEERTRQEREKILKDEHYYSHVYQHRSYLSRGIYVEQLQVWMNLFPREQFLILKSEDFYADPAAILKEVMSFLNVPVAESHLRKKEYKQYNNNSYSKMDAARRTRLVEYFKPHNARLYNYLGVDFGWDK